MDLCVCVYENVCRYFLSVSGCPPIFHPQWQLNVSVHAAMCVCVYICAESPTVHDCVYVASAHCWLSGAVCVGTQVQLLLSPVAVISELRGIISSLQLS